MLKKKLFVREKVYQKASFWRAAVNFLFWLVFLLLFRWEIEILVDFINSLRNGTDLEVSSADIILSTVKIFYNLIIPFVLFFIWVLFISQFVLPVKSNEERRLVFLRLLRYMFGFHGPAVFIENGVAIVNESELENTRPGVAFVDLSSSIALESQWEHVDKGKGFLSRLRRSHVFRFLERIIRWIIRTLINLIRRLLRIKPPLRPLVRIAGPGIVFTRMNEKIRRIADLRRQSRNADARVTTRDGIEIQVPVSVIFSLGDRPEILYVTYDWDASRGPWQQVAQFTDLRVFKKNEARNKVAQILDDLDDADKSEIHQFISLAQPTARDHEEELAGYDYPPYHFDEDRVFAALYSHAFETADSTPLDWTELPIHVAIEDVRDLIGEENYDALYKGETPGSFPLQERVLPEFRRFMRNQGVLWFQVVLRRDGKPIKKGDSWIPRELAFYPIRDLRNSKILRDRGIQVLSSNFSELTPKHQGVRDQMMDQWKSEWEAEQQEINSRADTDAANIVARAKRAAYREIISNLETAYTGIGVPKDAIALRLFQTIEQAMADPKTMALLPIEGMSLLVELRKYFQPWWGANPRTTPSGRRTP